MSSIRRRDFLRATGAVALPVSAPVEDVPKQASRPGTMLPAPREATPDLRRGPYLQAQSSDRILVRWRTDVSVKDSRLRVGESPGKLDREIVAELVPTPFAGVRDWVATVEGLEPSRTYSYQIEAENVILAGGDDRHRFSTAPPRGAPTRLRFLMLGDCGTNRVGTGNPGLAVAARNGFRRYNAGRGPIDGIVLLGDNAYSHGTDAQYQTALFSVYQDELACIPVWPCIGNHELTDDCLDIFSVPSRGEAGGVPSQSRNYYSFDHANVHFVILDLWKTEWRMADAPQRRWLEADLAATRQHWTIVVNHFPPYCDGKYESDTNGFLVEAREKILPVLEAHGVDMLVTGHDHTYQRSYLLDGHHGPRSTFDAARHVKFAGDGTREPIVKQPGPHGGIVVVVSGTAGAPQLANPANPKDPKLEHPVMVELAQGEQGGRGVRKLGSFLLEVDGASLTGTQVGEHGNTFDRFTLAKPAPSGPKG